MDDFKKAVGYIWIVNLVIIALTIWGLVATVNYVTKRGLKSIVNEVWNGDHK